MNNPLPEFKNEDEEREFWATHDSSEYVDWSRAQRPQFPNLKPSTQAISLRLPVSMLEELRRLANQRDVPYQSLIKVFLRERIDMEAAGGLPPDFAVREGPGVYKVHKRGRDFRTAGTEGKRYAMLSAEDWEALVEWLETLEDGQAIRKPLADLKAAGGNRQKAGWISWEQAEEDLE